MAVYTNDLRLKEIATGDESGTWGTSTNTNLGLIADAFGFGTEAITTNADTHTTTIADGSADPGRSIFLKYTGTLDSACTITIGPNTVSKLWFIENATSGSQNIIIKQGSGATITIANGQTKAIYSDGAGSGAAMVDAFTDLAVPSLFVEGATTITVSDNSDNLTLTTTDADANAGPSLMLFRDSSTPAASDRIATITYRGKNAADENVDYIVYDSFIVDATDGSEDAELDIRTMVGGSETTRLLLDPAETVFNEASSDIDFRVESDANTHAFFLEGSTGNVMFGGSTFDNGNFSGSANGVNIFDATHPIMLLKETTSNNTFEMGLTTAAAFLATQDAIPMKFATTDTVVFELAADGAPSTPTAGTSNVRLGVNAGDSIASGGNFNVVIGDEAGTALTTGDSNVAIGFKALFTEDAHGANVAIGDSALRNLNAGANGFNTAVGNEAGTSVTTGLQNTLIGARAGDALTTSSDNVAMGHEALSSQVDGASQNTAVGFKAGRLNTGGDGLTAFGRQALEDNTTGNNNVAIGSLAMNNNTVGNFSVAIGRLALQDQNYGTSTDAYNVAIGHEAGKEITTGTNNTIVGALAGDLMTDADFNTAVGYAALSSDILGTRSTAIGYNALTAQSFSTATQSYNSAVGFGAGGSITTGTQNTYLGGEAGTSNTGGSQNVAIGAFALQAETGSNFNVAIGREALKSQNSSNDSYNVAIGRTAGASITTAVQCTIIGSNAGQALTTGDANTAIGFEALKGVSTGSAASSNVAIGFGCMDQVTSADNNVAVGTHAGSGLTSGDGNIMIGRDAGDITTTGSKNIFIGQSSDPSTGGGNDQIVIGADTSGGGNSTVRFGNSAATATLTLDGSDTSWAAASDQRLKTDIETSPVGLDFINALRPVTYKWAAKNAIDEDLPYYDADSSDPCRGTEGKTHHGFVAQEVKSVIDANSSVKNGHNIWSEDPNGTQQVAPAALIPMLVKAIQELSAEIETLKSGG